MESEAIITRGNKVWLGEDGIFRIIHHPGAEVTLADAQETMAAFLYAPGFGDPEAGAGDTLGTGGAMRLMGQQSREANHD